MSDFTTARCMGNGRDECGTCLRKTLPDHPERQWWIGPWVLDTPCESRIPINKQEKT
jgi:hypothetical protein